MNTREAQRLINLEAAKRGESPIPAMEPDEYMRYHLEQCLQPGQKRIAGVR